MTTKEKVEVAPPVKRLDPGFYAELAALQKLEKKTLVIEGDDIEIAEDKIDSATDLLTLVRSLSRDVDKAGKEAEAKTIPEDILKEVNERAAERRAVTSLAAEISARVASGLENLYATGGLTKEGNTSKSGCRLSVITKKQATVEDADLIPNEFLLPRAQCIDMAKLAAAMKLRDEKVEAAAKLDLPPPPPIPGADWYESITFSTKAPDIIED